MVSTLKEVLKMATARAHETLEVQDKVVLVLYKMLYGDKYDCSWIGDEANPNHINAQKSNYIFGKLAVPAGRYSFCWNQYGPYSEELQKRLRALDGKDKEVGEYYKQLEETPDDTLGELFLPWQVERIQCASNIMKDVVKGQKGGELLGSLLYLSYTCLPGGGFKDINAELKRRKDYFPNDKENKAAWTVLQELDLVPDY